jgi:hypothetical protein
MAIKTASGSDLRNSLSSGLVLLNTTSFTAVASQSVNNVFSSTYDNYFLVLSELVGTTFDNINMRLRKSGTDNTSNIYYRQVIEASATTLVGARIQATSFLLGVIRDTTQIGFVVQIQSPNVATQRTNLQNLSSYSPPANITMTVQTASHDLSSSADFDGFTLIPASGTMTGKVSVYGYNK